MRRLHALLILGVVSVAMMAVVSGQGARPSQTPTDTTTDLLAEVRGPRGGIESGGRRKHAHAITRSAVGVTGRSDQYARKSAHERAPTTGERATGACALDGAGQASQ